MFRQLYRLLRENVIRERVLMRPDDPRVVALYRYAREAFPGHPVDITAFDNDRWAYLYGWDSKGQLAISMDVRGPRCATAALAAALECIAEDNATREDAQAHAEASKP